jgi:hypothetical protein
MAKYIVFTIFLISGVGTVPALLYLVASMVIDASIENAKKQ